MSIEISHLTKKYGQQYAVKDISFQVKKGEIVGFLGPNGAGKSTTMKIATSYIPPSGGQVRICGLDVTEEPLKVKKVVGYLPEHNPLYLEMYVHEYLQHIGAIYGLKGKSLLGRVGEMIELCGLTHEQNKRIESLSKGYRQRVGLAQALIHDPEVLILDEPTTGLDPNQLAEIREVIRNIGRDKTVILSTHIMQEVQALCDRVVLINKGELVADEEIEGLRSSKVTRQRIVVELNEVVESSFWNELKSVSEVLQIGASRFELFSDNMDIRKDVFNYVVSKNAVLIEIRQEGNDMESVFHQLTSKDN